MYLTKAYKQQTKEKPASRLPKFNIQVAENEAFTCVGDLNRQVSFILYDDF